MIPAARKNKPADGSRYDATYTTQVAVDPFLPAAQGNRAVLLGCVAFFWA